MPADLLTTRGARIIFEASRFLGLTELVENRKWDLLATPGHDAIADELVRILTVAGWQPSWPYCIAFIEAVWRNAYADAPNLQLAIAQILTPHCLRSWRNAIERGWTSVRPIRGAIGIMRNGSTDHGHAFLVESIGDGFVRTIEANTSPNSGTAEADRNGDGIYRKKRQLSFTPTAGLYLLGFILPPA
jgi:hypothetical protein